MFTLFILMCFVHIWLSNKVHSEVINLQPDILSFLPLRVCFCFFNGIHLCLCCVFASLTPNFHLHQVTMLFVYLKKLGCAVLNWGLSSCPEWFKMHTSLCPLLHVILISLCQCVFLVCLFKGITMQQSFMETSLGALVNLALKKNYVELCSSSWSLWI